MSEQTTESGILARLRDEIVTPAKSVIASGEEKEVTLMSGNYRFRKGNKSVHEWADLCQKEGINLETALRELAGDDYEVKHFQFSGYLGVTSDQGYRMKRIGT